MNALVSGVGWESDPTRIATDHGELDVTERFDKVSQPVFGTPRVSWLMVVLWCGRPDGVKPPADEELYTQIH